jgi:hypothetical protein
LPFENVNSLAGELSIEIIGNLMTPLRDNLGDELRIRWAMFAWLAAGNITKITPSRRNPQIP